MLDAIGAIVMQGGGGDSPQERLVLDAQRAATLDLVDVLHGAGVAPIIVAAPSLEWLSPREGVIPSPMPQVNRFTSAGGWPG